MATPAQAAAATVGAGSLAAAGAYGITSAVHSGEEGTDEPTHNDVVEKDPEPIGVVTFKLAASQSLDTNYSSKLLSVTKKSNLSKIVKPLEETTNKAWWDWAFKNKFSQKEAGKVDPVFNSVTKGYEKTVSSGENQIALNQACDKAYKKEKTDYSFEANSYLLQNISLFCTTGLFSFDISEPEATVFDSSENTTYSNKLAGVPTNKPKLVKPTGGENEYWWKWAYKNRFPTNKNDLATLFQAVTKGYSASAEGSENSRSSLNHACDDAYKKDNAGLTGTNNEKILENTKKFCTLTGNDALTTPTAVGG